MRALVATGAGAALIERDRPRPDAGEIRVAVAAAGICRTDLYAASGAIAAAPGVTLGHELAGTIDALGPGIRDPRLAAGALVSVDPRLRCGDCAGCARGADEAPCARPRVLGIDVDGAFADAVVIPASAAVPLPAGLSPVRAAFLEPLAAALGVVEVGLDRSWRGAVLGDGRIAELTARVLVACGHRPPLRAGGARELDANVAGALDYAVETGVEPSLDHLVAAVRPGGVIVLKSRPARPVSFDLRAAVSRRVTFEAIACGSFAAAADLLAGGSIVVDDLAGARFDLDDWQDAFAAARLDESQKIFFTAGGR